VLQSYYASEIDLGNRLNSFMEAGPMENLVMVGCDLHDKTMLLKIGCGQGAAVRRSFENSPVGRQAMIADLKRRALESHAVRIVFAYEASGLGFGLHDELTDNGIICHVLAPSNIERSSKQRRNKTDEKDADRLLEILRGHHLAGNRLPHIWVPDKQTRDDRELLRARLDVHDKCTAVKAQVRTLLKRNAIVQPKACGVGWTINYWIWLVELTTSEKPLGFGARRNLASLLRQIHTLQAEIKKLDKDIAVVARHPRYAKKVATLRTIKGVGLLVAMVFLTEIGDPTRFRNRRQIGAYLGLTPSSHESGECDDRKGHITHQGPARVRYVLTQAVWNRVRFDPQEKVVYDRIAGKNPKHKKIAVVAAMRRLAIKMWHLVQPNAAAG
jgi:transposase